MAISEQLAKLVGRDVHLRGTPFAAHTAHHHAPIVMEVAKSMRFSQHALHCLRHCWTTLVLLGMSLSSAAAVESVSVEDLASKPDDYLGKEVELAGYCTKGGATGDVLDYECRTDGGVYVDVRDIEPDTAKKKLDNNCAGKGAAEGNASCRATIRFVPHSFTTSTKVEPGKDIVIFNTNKAEASF
jgi:hypothetical protein